MRMDEKRECYLDKLFFLGMCVGIFLPLISNGLGWQTEVTLRRPRWGRCLFWGRAACKCDDAALWRRCPVFNTKSRTLKGYKGGSSVVVVIFCISVKLLAAVVSVHRCAE